MSCGEPDCARLGSWCEACVRRRHYGALAVYVTALHDSEANWNALDALGAIMRERHALQLKHRKEEFEAQRAAQRDARDAYHEGHAEGRREEGNW